MTKPKLELESAAPGIVGLLVTFPQVGARLSSIAQCLLAEEHVDVTIPRYIREYIAGSCSQVGRTEFCENSHFAAALACSPHVMMEQLHAEVLNTPKWKALETFAHQVYSRPSTVTREDVVALKHFDFTEAEVHLVMAIACAFRMFNAYVKAGGNPGLGTPDAYKEMGHTLAKEGYVHH